MWRSGPSPSCWCWPPGACIRNDLVGSIKSAFFGIKVGDVTISLSSVIVALLLFGVGFGLTRAAQSWLENRYLPLTQIDTGLRASIGASIGYLGVIASVSFALAYLGINTEKLALVAGALVRRYRPRPAIRGQ